MKNKKIFNIFAIILLVLVSVASICSASVEFTDSSGEIITLTYPAERIVCLNSDGNPARACACVLPARHAMAAG